MTPFRRRAVWLAASVLLVQLTALAAPAATAICCRRATTSPMLMDCCKGEGHSCPLMKKQQAPAGEQGTGMKSCPGAGERVTALLFGARGVLAVRVVTDVVPRVVAVIESVQRSAATRYAPVETPPPRG